MYSLSDTLSSSWLRLFACLFLMLLVLAALLFISMHLQGIPGPSGPPLAPTAVEYAV
jgi:hypothetical protein